MPRFICRENRPFTPKAAVALAPCEGILARLLYTRGIDTYEEARDFLNPSEDQLHDPALLYGLTDCVKLFRGAKEKGQRIVVYGDYDADGICAATILSTALRRFGIPTGTYTPLRAEGYGLNKPAIEKLRREYDILVTVDLGITNHEEVRYAQSLGMTVAVTDHHRLEGGDSPANVVVHPALGSYPTPKLCGTGVAFKLAQGLLGLDGCRDLLDVAALGTVADLVPLVGENRVIVTLGLPLIGEAKRPGIKALLNSACWEKEVTSDTIAYQLAPRLNSTGRMGDANDGVRLMLTEDPAEAQALAEKIELLNTQRRAEENSVVAACEKLVEGHDFTAEWAVMVRGEQWNAGVVGLAAGRLMQHFGCPSCVLTKSGENQLTGSLRSVPGVNIHECLTRCKDLLVRFGGHEAAAGVTLLESNYDTFRERLQAEIMKAAPVCFFPRQEYDVRLDLSALNEALMRDLDRLAPFGFGNPAPLLASFGVHLEERRVVGDGSHLKLNLRQGDAVMDGIAFGKGALASRLPDTVDTVYQLSRNTFRGVTKLQMQVTAIAPEEKARLSMILSQTDEAESLGLVRALAALPEGGEVPDFIAENEEEGLPKLLGTLSALERGHLLVCRSRGIAGQMLESLPTLFLDQDDNLQLFPHLLIRPTSAKDVSGGWRHIWLLEGMIAPEELAMWKKACPKAVLHVFPRSKELQALAAAALPDKPALRRAFVIARDRVCTSLDHFAKLSGLELPQASAALIALREAGLIRYRETPFTVLLAAKTKADPCELSPTWKRVSAIAGDGE